jgi:membrane fusion protein, heavy metal efflux system
MTKIVTGPFRQYSSVAVAVTLVLITAWLETGCKTTARDDSREETKKARTTEVRDVTMTSEQIQLGGVRWEPVKTIVMTDTVDMPGQLGPNEDRTARLSAPARGRVVTVHVRIGDRVTRGQRLVTLQSEQAAAARADLAKAVAELNARQQAATFARTALDRAERLLELKSVSRQDVERARVEHEQATSLQTQAEAELERARATLAQLGVDPDTGEMILRAPLTGIVLSRDAIPGAVVDPGAALVMVTDPTTLWLEIAATERAASALRVGRQVRFAVPELGSERFEATIENVGGALDPATRTLPVRGLVRNRPVTLRPAMFVTVTLPLSQSHSGVVVPDSAIQLLDERRVVFVAQADAKGGARFERRDVEVGASAGGQVQILTGVTAGDHIVIDGAFAVKSEFARAKIPSES